MEIANMILECLRVLIWPVLIALSLAAFRKEFTSTFRRLTGAGLPGGFALDFEPEIQDAGALSQEIAKNSRPRQRDNTPVLPLIQANARMISLGLEPSPSGLDMHRYLDLASQDPNLALAGLRMEVEVLARNLAKGFRVEISAREGVSPLFRRLRDAEAISSTQFELVQKVVRLCNAAIHGTRVSREEAESVIKVADVLARDYLSWLSWGFDDNWIPQDNS